MFKDGKHFPSDPQKFVFDEEVTQVFPDMALRSIPMYAEAHRMHAEMLFCANEYSMDKPLVVYDIGASRGGFLQAICRQCLVPMVSGAPYLRFVAIDSSSTMLDALSAELPWVQTVCSDVLELPDFTEKADVISMFYLLQFIHGAQEQLAVLKWVYRNLKPGGLFISGHKGEPSSSLVCLFPGTRVSRLPVICRSSTHSTTRFAGETDTRMRRYWQRPPHCGTPCGRAVPSGWRISATGRASPTTPRQAAGCSSTRVFAQEVSDYGSY